MENNKGKFWLLMSWMKGICLPAGVPPSPPTKGRWGPESGQGTQRERGRKLSALPGDISPVLGSHWDGPFPLSLPPSPPPIPPRMLTIDVIHLEEEFEFVHGAAVDEQGQCLLQLLKCDGATSIRVKQDKESLSKERLWPEEDRRWVQMWPWSLGFEFIHCVCVCVCVCTYAVGWWDSGRTQVTENSLWSSQWSHTRGQCPWPILSAENNFGLW